MLEKIDTSLWLCDGEIVNFFSFPYPTRSVIARLGNGDLWVWSPVKLVPQLRDELEVLGPVRHLVSPNKIHHLYLHEWRDAYPEAMLWGPQSTINKRRDLKFQEPLQDTAPSEWQPDIEQAWFRGSFAMDEIVFYHRPSRAVLVADMIEALENDFLKKHWSWWRRVLGHLDGITAEKSLAPAEWRLSFIHRRPARAARDRVLSWPAERVIMAHGDWLRAGGRAYLKRSFRWLGTN